MTTLATRSTVPVTRPSFGQQIVRWSIRIMTGLLIVVLVLLAVGFAYQQWATARDATRYPPPGELVDVGDYRLHLHVTGTPQGPPTVILENGGGGISPQWGWVRSALAEETQVVSYDRPGTGWSEAPPTTLSAEEAMRDLHSALEQQGVEGPYVLVGHSMGGLLARVFAKLYPDEVAGMVLADPRDITWEGVYEESEGKVNTTFFSAVATLSRFGVTRLVGMAAHMAEGLPEQQYQEAVAVGSTSHQMDGMLRDAEYGETAIEFLIAGEDTYHWPLIVLSAGRADADFNESRRPGFTALQRRLAGSLSTQGEHRMVAEAGHIPIVTHAEHAEVVVRAVREVLARASR